MEVRQFKAALDDYTQAVALDPENSNWYIKRAKALQQLGAKEAAESDLRRAAELRPGAKRSTVPADRVGAN